MTSNYTNAQSREQRLRGSQIRANSNPDSLLYDEERYAGPLPSENQERRIIFEPFQMPSASQLSLETNDERHRPAGATMSYDKVAMHKAYGQSFDANDIELRAILSSIKKIDNRLQKQEEQQQVQHEETNENQNREKLRFYRERAGVYLQATVFIAALGASLMSFAHDSLQDLDLAHNITDNNAVRLDLAPTGCGESDFTVAVAAFQVSVLYSVFATMVVLSASASLGVGWWRAIWIRVRDRNQDGKSIPESSTQERVSSLISQLFTAKVLMYSALLFLLGGLISMSLCIFSDTAFGWQFLIGCAGLIFVFRYSIALIFIIPYEWLKRLFGRR